MYSQESFVVALCAVICLLVAFLTVVTQIKVDFTPWRGWVRSRWRGKTTAAPRKPGKKARKSQRRRERLTAKEKLANIKDKVVERVPSPISVDPDSAFTLYEKHLSEERESQRNVLCAQLQSFKTQTRTLEFPCSGCGLVNAKKNCSYHCCASCCRENDSSVCRAHGTGYLAASAAVESAIHYQFLEFDLSYAHLRKCPPNVSLIGPQLVSLNLSNNRLATLPHDIGNLYGLQELFLQYNCLTKMPDSVCNLLDLVELDVKNNRLTEVPDDIGNLQNLLILSLTNNHIAHLPKSIGRLQMLEELSLHSNHLTELPDEICELTELRIMYNGENRLQTLPARFGQLRNLEELDISGCELATLPDSLSLCESLVRLWLSNNRLVSLPPHIGDLQQLKELHVRHNRLRCLPASIERLHLYTFTAQNNCLIDEQTAQAHCNVPREPLPSLLEMAARVVINYNVTWEPGSIPKYLDDMLKHPSRCSRCSGPFFQYFSSEVVFKTIGVFFRVPLYRQFCSPHLNNQCKPSSIGQ